MSAVWLITDEACSRANDGQKSRYMELENVMDPFGDCVLALRILHLGSGVTFVWYLIV